jgi:uncharacterized metal-binding protein
MIVKKVTKLVFTCSGAADVGELTDRAARQLARDGTTAMSCLASIAARDEDILFNAEHADCVLLIDGCPKACALHTFELAGLRHHFHFDLGQIGMRKKSSPATSENIGKVVAQAVEVLTAH